MIRKIDGGIFNDSPHGYRDDAGKWVVSLTQLLKFQGLSDYYGIAHDVMENASRRGSDVHSICESFDRYGDFDPSWITEETKPYFEGWQEFLADTGFIVDKDWIERGLITSVFGMTVGMKLDRRGLLNGQDTVCEIKCTSAIQPSWAIQTAGQELGVQGGNRCGRMGRIAVQLRKSGKKKYKIDRHENHDEDPRQLSYALGNLHWRIKAGQKLWERL